MTKRTKKKLIPRKTVKHHLHDFFIPHAGNNHAPHILHPKRAVLYGAVAAGAKALVVLTTALMPLEAFLAPDILAAQQEKLVTLVNETRAEQGLTPLTAAPLLRTSAQLKADDMASNDYFDHNGPDGRDFKYFLRSAGYDYHLAGENLAMGFSDARAVVNAWIKSPLHYRNIVEPDFKEMGMSLAVGEHGGEETIYIANHFGDPIVTVAIASKPLVAPATAPAKEIPEAEEVRGTTADTPAAAGRPIEAVTQTAPIPSSGTMPVPAPAAPAFNYDAERSKVYWEYEEGITDITVRAYIEGAVVSALATVDEYSILLAQDPAEANLYIGTLTVPKPINDFFKVIIEPSIEIVGADNSKRIDTIQWYEIKIADQTPLMRYEQTKDWMPSFAQALFAAENALYLFFLVFFVIALAINLLVEIRTQRPHVIIPTVLLIMLVGMLWWI